MIILTLVAAIAPPQRQADPFYGPMTERAILPGCAEIHCFRVLVPWTLGRLPGPVFLKWKAYAVAANTAAAIAAADLCLLFGCLAPVAVLAFLLSAFGFGSFYTLYDPFNSDPLMFWLAPVVTVWLLEERTRRAALVACLSVFAKEFVVIVVAMTGLWAASLGRWRLAWRAALLASAAFLLWGALHVTLMRQFAYSYGPNHSGELLSGSYLAVWLRQLSPATALAALGTEYGAAYLLIPVGWWGAPRLLRRLALAAVPFAAFMAYVEQPDRAWWNFHFIACPLAAIVLAELPAPLAWAFVTAYAVANLRTGAQIAAAPPARFAVAVSAAIAVAAIVTYLGPRGARPVAPVRTPPGRR